MVFVGVEKGINVYTMTMTSLLTDVSTVFDKIVEIAGDVLNFIVSNPITLMGFILGIIGLAIGLVSKFRR